MAAAAIPVMDLDYMHQGFTGNDAACNPELQFANLISLISVLLFTVPVTELCYDTANAKHFLPWYFTLKVLNWRNPGWLLLWKAVGSNEQEGAATVSCWMKSCRWQTAYLQLLRKVTYKENKITAYSMYLIMTDSHQVSHCQLCSKMFQKMLNEKEKIQQTVG